MFIVERYSYVPVVIQICSLLLLLLTIPVSVFGQQVKDDFNRTLTVTAPIQRIISLAPHLSELVFSAGAGEKLVGISRHCDYPPEVLTLPQVSDYQSINFEQIALLEADLILVWDAVLKNNRLDLLQRLSKNVYVSAPKTLDDIADNLIDIGILADTSVLARRRAESFLSKVATLQKNAQSQPTRSVLYLLWEDPPTTVSNQHWIGQLISLCGGHNIYGDAPTEIINVNRESLLLNQPQIILHSLPQRQTVLPKHIPAVYITHDFVQRPSLRTQQGLEEVCRALSS